MQRSRYSGWAGWPSRNPVSIWAIFMVYSCSFIACKQLGKTSSLAFQLAVCNTQMPVRKERSCHHGPAGRFPGDRIFCYAVAAAFPAPLLPDGCRYLNPYPVPTKPMGSSALAECQQIGFIPGCFFLKLVPVPSPSTTDGALFRPVSSWICDPVYGICIFHQQVHGFDRFTGAGSATGAAPLFAHLPLWRKAAAHASNAGLAIPSLVRRGS